MTQPAHLQLVGANGERAKHEAVKIAPNDLDCEASLLSAILIDHGAQLATLADFLEPEHFWSESHRWIYRACVELHRAKTPVDTTTVGTWLKSRSALETAGGMAYITEILPAAPAIADSHQRAYAVSIYDLWRARRAIATMQEYEARGYLGPGDIQEWLDKSARLLSDIALRNVGGKVESNSDTLRRMVKALFDAQYMDKPEHAVTGTSTGLRTLDELTNGLHAGQKTTITALPRIGKTAFALQIAMHVAQQGIGVLFFVTEQTREEILTRMVANMARVSGARFQAAKMTDAEWRRVHEAMPKIEALPLHIYASASLDIAQLRAITMARVERARIDRVPIGLIVMDYAQRLSPLPAFPPNTKKHITVGATTLGFKQLLLELKIPGIELAQQRRLEKNRKTGLMPKPGLGDTADCSDIEKEADNLYFLYRNPKRGYGGRIVGESADRLTLIVAKQRGGEEREMQLEYIGEQYRFECLDDDATPPDEAPARAPSNAPEPPKEWAAQYEDA